MKSQRGRGGKEKFLLEKEAGVAEMYVEVDDVGNEKAAFSRFCVGGGEGCGYHITSRKELLPQLHFLRITRFWSRNGGSSRTLKLEKNSKEPKSKKARGATEEEQKPITCHFHTSCLYREFFSPSYTTPNLPSPFSSFFLCLFYLILIQYLLNSAFMNVT